MWEDMERTREYGFGEEVKRRIMIGTYALSAGYYDAYYLKAQKVRTLIRREFDAAFERFDVLLAPTSPTPAFRIGEKVDDPLAMYLSDVCTLPVNIAGVPGMSIPCGFEDGLPIGLQIIGKPFDEATIFRAGYAYQQATELAPASPITRLSGRRRGPRWTIERGVRRWPVPKRRARRPDADCCHAELDAVASSGIRQLFRHRRNHEGRHLAQHR